MAERERRTGLECVEEIPEDEEGDEEEDGDVGTVHERGLRVTGSNEGVLGLLDGSDLGTNAVCRPSILNVSSTAPCSDAVETGVAALNEDVEGVGLLGEAGALRGAPTASTSGLTLTSLIPRLWVGVGLTSKACTTCVLTDGVGACTAMA